MSILRAKIHSGSKHPARPVSTHRWDGLHLRLSEQITTLLGEDFEPAELGTRQSRLKHLKADMPGPQAIYCFTGSDQNVIGLISLNPQLTAMITASAVHSERGSEAFEGQVRLVDVFLCEPLAQLTGPYLTQQLGWGDSTETVQLTSKVLTWDDLELGSDNASWTRLDMDFVKEMDEAAEPAAAQMENGAETDNYDETARPAPGLSLWLPTNLLDQMKPEEADETAGSSISPMVADDPWAIHMRGALKKVPVCIRAVLDSQKMSVADCTRLEIGQIIALDGASTDTVRLETQTQDGAVTLTDAVLGAYRSHRALRISSDIDPNFLADILDLDMSG